MYEDLDTTLNFEDDYVLVYKKSYFELVSSMLDEYDEKDLGNYNFLLFNCTIHRNFHKLFIFFFVPIRSILLHKPF